MSALFTPAPHRDATYGLVVLSPRHDLFQSPIPLQVYRLSSKYQPPAACMEPILAALSAVEATDIDLALLSDVYSLPAGLLESPSLEKVAAACKQKLLCQKS